MPNDFNQQIIDEFRANSGRVAGPFEGARLILLTTTGVRSGAPHTTPVGYLPDGDRILVIASAGGAPRHPDWYHNLVADPSATVEDGVFTYQARAEVLTGAERDEVFARAVEADPGWAAYQAKTSRVIPVLALRQVAGGPPNAASWGAALKLVHDAFRRELALIRDEVARSGPGLGAQLRVNCLTVCQGLHHHHRNEDAGMFTGLAERRPDLAATLARLREEHRRVAALVDRLQRVVGEPDADPVEVRRQVERLTTELEAHLTYEEEQLIPVLDEAG
ncbi:deazaflavin-dependent oxidoreductase, nitroreductase family [Micromonospora citrea]|uniref:Deazaflavin-dependent oxidoreductase, nitroreductase family n=1 Tax=Micromonospora citrea TaxID=47855 RepID=A0A1C6W2B4_9ACTN|nr:nitroreductase/quinone reductase family protein [Micromonospora citrea]SCL72729.1 deazaflavin-dependent oxidoreductase, nitroreductase family [Micromonospora citrea]